MQKLAAIVGPTAVGKTDISIKVAQLIGAEIISCDSMQVYRGMDIGTAKVTRKQQELVKHHQIDIVNIDFEYNLALYQNAVKALIRDINLRGKFPLLVGGTGLYYQSIADDYQLLPMESTSLIRAKYEKEIELKGIGHLYKKLSIVDRDYAERISPHDRKRIIRGLEVYELTGKPFSFFQVKKEDAYNFAVAGLYLERRFLYPRIEERVEEMFKNGFIEEVQKLIDSGYNLCHRPMQGLGYKQVYQYLHGLITHSEMRDDIKRETRRYAKRQYTWFKRDPRIKWFNITEFRDSKALSSNISDYLKGQLSKDVEFNQ